MVEPSIVKKTKTRTRVHDEGGGISHEEAEGKGPGTNTRGYVGPWTQARTDGSVCSRPRERKSEESRARRASSTSGGSFSTDNCAVSSLFFSILQMISHVFMADVGHSGQILSYADSAWSCVGNDMPCLSCC